MVHEENFEVEVNINEYLEKYFNVKGRVVITCKTGMTIKQLIEEIATKYGSNRLENISTTEKQRKLFVVIQEKSLSNIDDVVTSKKIKIIPPLSGG